MLNSGCGQYRRSPDIGRYSTEDLLHDLRWTRKYIVYPRNVRRPHIAMHHLQVNFLGHFAIGGHPKDTGI